MISDIPDTRKDRAVNLFLMLVVPRAS